MFVNCSRILLLILLCNDCLSRKLFQRDDFAAGGSYGVGTPAVKVLFSMLVFYEQVHVISTACFPDNHDEPIAKFLYFPFRKAGVFLWSLLSRHGINKFYLEMT